jgi:hypothetical protein
MYTTVEHVQPRGNAGIERMQTSYNPNHDNFPAHLQHQHQLQQPLVTGTSYHPSPPPPSSQRSKKRLPLKTRLLIAGEKCMDVLVRFLGPCLSILCVSLIAFITYVYFTEVFPMLNARVCHGATDDALRRYTARGDWSIETLRGRIGILDSRSGRFLPGGDRSRLEQMRAQTAAIEASVELDGCSQTYLITSFGVYLLFNIVFHYFATMLKGPGRPPSTPFGQEVLDHLSQYDPERRDDQNIRFCKPCNQVKPMRAHRQ